MPGGWGYLGTLTHLVDSGRHPQHLAVGVDKHVAFVADLVVPIGAADGEKMVEWW